MAFLITTTGTLSPVVFPDLGGRSLAHLTTDYDLNSEYTLEELTQSLTNGDIGIAVTAGYITIQDEYGNDLANAVPANTALQLTTNATNEITGFPSLIDANISFTDGTYTFTIAPAVSEFSYFIKNSMITKTSSEQIVINDTVNGIHFFYYDGETLSTTPTYDNSLILTKALIAIGYWDSTNKTMIALCEERHGFMPGVSHLLHHLTEGTEWLSGLGLSGFAATRTGALDTHAQLGYDTGKIADEDLQFTISNIVAPANLKVFYRLGVNGDWRLKNADAYPFVWANDPDGPTYIHPNSRIAWNEFTGGAWQLTEATNNWRVMAHFFAINDTTNPIVVALGNNEYKEVKDAEAAIGDEIASIISDGFISAEFVSIGSIILKTSNYANAPKAFIDYTVAGADYLDTRTIRFLSASSPTTHNVLTGRSDLNSHPALAIATSVLNFDKRLTISEDTVQKALEKLDDYPFGLEFQFAVAAGESSTTLLAYQQKLRLTTPTIPAGDYFICYFYNYSSDDENNEMLFQVEVDDITQIYVSSPTQIKKYADGVYKNSMGFNVVTLTNAIHTIDLDYANSGGKTTYIKNAIIALWRVT